MRPRRRDLRPVQGADAEPAVKASDVTSRCEQQRRTGAAAKAQGQLQTLFIVSGTDTGKHPASTTQVLYGRAPTPRAALVAKHVKGGVEPRPTARWPR
jgi:hypothetical protein